MADSPRFESPIRMAPSGGSALRDESHLRKTLVRAAADSATASSLGVGFGSSRRMGDTLVCGTRPGEWLILSEPGDPTPDIDTDGFVSVVDWTHGRAVIRVTSEQSARALEKLCSLDLTDDMTPDGAVASASVAKVACDLIRDDRDGPRSYLIACDRSLGDYLFGALADACNEFHRS